MNKSLIVEKIISVLAADFAALQLAVKVAHESATHGESKAENKYDTRGLEAAYLAHGQARRAEEIEAALSVYEAIDLSCLQKPSPIVGISSLVQLADQSGLIRWLWMGAEAGGLSFLVNETPITLVTPKSPLGAALIARQQGDVFELRVADALMEYEILVTY